MPQIMINLTKLANKNVKVYMGVKDFSDKRKAIIDILENFELTLGDNDSLQ